MADLRSKLVFGAVDVSAIERSPSQVILFCFQLSVSGQLSPRQMADLLLFDCANKFHITTISTVSIPSIKGH